MQLGEVSLHESILQGRALSESILRGRRETTPQAFQTRPNEGAEAAMSPLAATAARSCTTLPSASAAEEEESSEPAPQTPTGVPAAVLATIHTDSSSPAPTQAPAPTGAAPSTPVPAPAASDMIQPGSHLHILSVVQKFAHTKPWRKAKHGRSVVIDADWSPPQGWKSEELTQPVQEQKAELTPIQRQQRWLNDAVEEGIRRSRYDGRYD